MQQGLSNFLFHFKRIFQVYLLGLLLFFITRLFFLIRIGKEDILTAYKGDLLKAFIVGARFDTMVLTYGLLVPLILAFFSLFIKKKNYQEFVSSFSKKFMLIVMVFFAMILIIDIYYYSYFQSHINVLFFGFFEDDTAAVMKSVWTDYPLIRVLLVLILLVWLLSKFLNKIFLKFQIIDILPSTKGAFILVLIVLAFYFIGMRGSLGTFPLQVDDSTISDNATINLLPINGLFALKEAWMTRKKQMNIHGNGAWLKQLGYDNQSKAVGDYFGINTAGVPEDSLYSYYFVRTGSNDFLKKNPPNVIFFQMESMSNYNLTFHSDALNLLGALEPFWNSEILFRKCLPIGNGTINSLEGIMVSTPVTSLAQSDNRYKHFSSSVALPFKNAGYHTTYITGGKLGWRNINEFIPNQYFDQVDGNANIQKAIPQTQQCEWGVYDEYLFDYVFKQLEESHGKPQMIFAMTTTNHTPFNLPDHYKPYPVKIPGNMKGKLLTEEKLAVKNFTNLQYSNDCLGKFLEKLKSSPFAQNTIVAATGDHNNLMLFDFAENQVLEKRGVPLLMYIPKKYIEGHRVDTSLFVSHNDIFPTLINLALSDAVYFNCGNFVFDKNLPGSSFFSVDLMSREIVNDHGAVIFDPPAAYFLWNTSHTELTRIAHADSTLISLQVKASSFYAAMSYFIKQEIDHSKKK